MDAGTETETAAAMQDRVRFCGSAGEVRSTYGLTAAALWAVSYVSFAGEFLILKWIASSTRGSDGRPLRWEGSIFVLLGLHLLSLAHAEGGLKLLGVASRFDVNDWRVVGIAAAAWCAYSVIVGAPISYFWTRYVVTRLSTQDGVRAAYCVPFWQFVVRYVFVAASFLTIVGWGVTASRFLQWQCRGIIAPGGHVRFTGTAGALYWRAVALGAIIVLVFGVVVVGGWLAIPEERDNLTLQAGVLSPIAGILMALLGASVFVSSVRWFVESVEFSAAVPTAASERKFEATVRELAPAGLAADTAAAAGPIHDAPRATGGARKGPVSTVEKKLDQIERLYTSGRITMKERIRLRAEVLERLT